LLEDNLDFTGLLRFILRFWLVLILGAIVGILIGFYTFDSTTPKYSSTAKLFVDQTVGTAGLTARDLDDRRRVSELYVDLAMTQPILDAIAANDNVPLSGGEVGGRINLEESRSFISITATDGDPVIAATLANTTAITLISELVDRRLAQVSLTHYVLAEQLGLVINPSPVSDQTTTLPELSLVEEATPSGTPLKTDSSRAKRGVVGGAIGLLGTFGLMFIRTTLSDKIKNEDELTTSTGIFNLGVIPAYDTGRNEVPIVASVDDRRHPASEAYSIIRANMDTVLPDGAQIRSILITGPGPGEGKSTVAANIAALYAIEGIQLSSWIQT
jgi:polysaccharide biosynthesis transport protein